MSKINKLGKSTFVITILSFILVAVLAFGGTYAYFADKTEKFSSTVTTGTIKLTSSMDSDTLVQNGTFVVPGQPLVNEAINVQTATTVNTIMFAVVNAKVEGTGTTIALALTPEAAWNNVVELQDGSKAYVYKDDQNFFFNDNKAEADESTKKEFTKSAIYLDKDVSNIDGEGNYINMGVQITIEVAFYTAQYDYLSGTNGTEFTGSTAEAVYSAVKTHVYKDLPAVKTGA